MWFQKNQIQKKYKADYKNKIFNYKAKLKEKHGLFLAMNIKLI